jgi:putative ABC transport system substrate-binding protein
LPKVGVLVAGTPDPAVFLLEFRKGLRDQGYIESKNIALEIRSAGSTDPTKLREVAADLVQLKVAVLVAFQTPPALAAKDVAREIPIVMAGVGDAVGSGLVASLARPGSNVTGISSATAESAGKLVELIHDLLPTTKQVGALCNGIDPFSKPFLQRIELAGAALGMEIRPAFAQGAPDVEVAFSSMMKSGIDAVVVQPSLGVRVSADLALSRGLPSAAPTRLFAQAGGLMSYSGNQAAIYAGAATFVDKILKGAKPADLPVQEPNLYDFVINAETADKLGLTIPPVLLARATQVIQ